MASQVMVQNTFESGTLDERPEPGSSGSMYYRTEIINGGTITTVYVSDGIDWIKISPIIWTGIAVTNGGSFNISWGSGIFDEIPLMQGIILNNGSIGFVAFESLTLEECKGRAVNINDILNGSVPQPLLDGTEVQIIATQY